MNILPLAPYGIHSMWRNKGEVMMYILRTQSAWEAYPQNLRIEFFDYYSSQIIFSFLKLLFILTPAPGV